MWSWQKSEQAKGLADGSARFRVYKAKKKWVLHYAVTGKVWKDHRRRFTTHSEALATFNEILAQSAVIRQRELEAILLEHGEVNA